MEREDILTKLKKLRAMAEDASDHNETAAAAAAEKMRKLMEEHAVAEHELEDYKSLERVGLDYGQKYFDKWRLWLMHEASLSCGTYMIYFRKGDNKRFRIYGRPHACEATWEMFKFLEGQVVRISREMYDVTKLQRQAQKGLALGVAQKMQGSRDLDQSNPAQLPVVLETTMSQEAMNEAEGNVKAARKTKTTLTAASVNGFNNADRVQLREEIE